MYLFDFLLLGVWWPVDDVDSWRYLVYYYLPITTGINFVKNVIEKQYFSLESLLVLCTWTVALVIITLVDITNKTNGKWQWHNKL